MSRQRGFFSLGAAWAIPVLALLTFVLGTWAWLERGASVGDALYRSVALFDIGNNYYTGENPLLAGDWRFQVARWTGLTALSGAAILALMALLQERVALLIARWVKQEVVVIGDDAIAAKAFEAARSASKSVVWLGAPDLGAGAVRSIALPWPPEDHAKSVMDHALDADHVLIAQADDASALALVRAARAAAPSAWITVLMKDVRLAEDAADTFNDARTRVLSQASIAARALSIQHPPFLLAREAMHARVHALIVGFGKAGQAIVRDLIVNGRTTYLGRPRITVVDPRATALRAVLHIRAPEIDSSAELAFIDGEIGSNAISPSASALTRAIIEGGPVTAVYVCLATDSDALATAGMLQAFIRALPGDAPAIFVRLRDAGVVSTNAEDSSGLDALTPFGDLQSILTASEFLSNLPDATARAFNEAYRASLAPERRDDPTNRSARPWDALAETYRQVSRDAVAHIPAKLASAGIDPELWRGLPSVPALGDDLRLYSSDAELEAMAELEHERWNAQRRMDGWRWADLPSKDEARKLHPDLRPYEELTDPVKEYDRVHVRETEDKCRRMPRTG